MLGTTLLTYVAVQWLLLAASARRQAGLSAEEVAELRGNMTENSILLFPTDLPPLLCDMSKDSSERLSRPADFYALARVGFIMYCSFQTDVGDTSRLVRLNEIKLDRIFGWSDDDGHFGNYQPKRDLNSAKCTLDSEMPASFFDFTALRRYQEKALKCYGNPAGETALFWFKDFPAVLCTMDAELDLRGASLFTLPGIAGDPFRCAFAPFAAVPLAKEDAAQESLQRSLTERFVLGSSSGFPRYSCTVDGGSNDTDVYNSTQFKAQAPSGVLYTCTFLDLKEVPPVNEALLLF